MKYKGKTKPGEGMALLVLLAVCAAAIVFTALTERPEREIMYPIHAVPEGFGEYDDALIDINSASVAELEKLPGVGEVLAGRIVAWREENGGFQSIEDVMLVNGIGESLFAGMKDMISVGGR